MEHSEIAYSGGYGLECLCDLGSFANNDIEHTQMPMRLRLDNVGHIGASNKIVNNDKQQIDVIGNKTLTKDSTWHDLGLPYNLRFFVTIDANLKLDPGVALRMGDDSTLSIDEGGSLNVVDSADRPIVIRGWSEHPGYWDGIAISIHSGKNVFRYAKIADGGRSGPEHANFDDEGYLKLEHSWIENSRNVGVWVDENSGVQARLEASNNAFKNVKVNIKSVH